MTCLTKRPRSLEFVNSIRLGRVSLVHAETVERMREDRDVSAFSRLELIRQPRLGSRLCRIRIVRATLDEIAESGCGVGVWELAAARDQLSRLGGEVAEVHFAPLEAEWREVVFSSEDAQDRRVPVRYVGVYRRGKVYLRAPFRQDASKKRLYAIRG